MLRQSSSRASGCKIEYTDMHAFPHTQTHTHTTIRQGYLEGILWSRQGVQARKRQTKRGRMLSLTSGGGQNKNEGNTEADGADHVRISLRIRPKHVCKILVCDVAKGPGKFEKLCGFGTRTRAGQVGRLRVKSCAVYSFTYS